MNLSGVSCGGVERNAVAVIKPRSQNQPSQVVKLCNIFSQELWLWLWLWLLIEAYRPRELVPQHSMGHPPKAGPKNREKKNENAGRGRIKDL